jgi:hypothetical protein
MRSVGPDRDHPVFVQPSLLEAIAALRETFDASGAAQLFGRPLRSWRMESRRGLGLDDTRPIVMTGHQAGIWHAGILAKWIVADLLRERSGSDVAAIIVDQDVNDAALVEYPALVEGRLERARLPLSTRSELGPTGTRRSVHLEAPSVPPVPEVADALEAIRGAVNAEANAANLALQMSLANSALLASQVGRVANVTSTSLLRTPLGQRVIAAMRDDAEACRTAYNDALALDPHVARPLGPGELPLWLLESGRREPLGLDRLNDALRTQPERVAPRAFLMTAVARLGFCDLFIHGTGGERYERVTETWIAKWLGVQLAPMAIATATLRLPLERYLPAQPLTTPAEFRRYAFDPDGHDGVISPRKRELLAAISAAPRGSSERRAEYRNLLRYLDEARSANESTLELHRARLNAAKGSAVASDLVRSRMWPWALHAANALSALRTTLAAK